MAKKLKTIAVVIAFLIAFALPVGLVIGLSEAEKQEYQPVEGFDFSGDYAYGAVVQPEYRTMREYMLVSGTYMPYATQFVDLSSYSGLRFYVEAGDEIAAGQTIAVADGGEEVLSPIAALVDGIDVSGGYVRLLSLEEVALECYVSRSYADLIGQMQGTLTDENGETVELLFRSLQVTDGNVLVRLKSGMSGDVGRTGAFKLYTGTVYENVLCVPGGCLYTNNAGETCVRKVNADGSVIGEQVVATGYSDGEYIMITSGISAGDLLDGGASAYYG